MKKAPTKPAPARPWVTFPFRLHEAHRELQFGEPQIMLIGNLLDSRIAQARPLAAFGRTS
jgi:hypothetical protein